MKAFGHTLAYLTATSTFTSIHEVVNTYCHSYKCHLPADHFHKLTTLSWSFFYKTKQFLQMHVPLQNYHVYKSWCARPELDIWFLVTNWSGGRRDTTACRPGDMTLIRRHDELPPVQDRRYLNSVQRGWQITICSMRWERLRVAKADWTFVMSHLHFVVLDISTMRNCHRIYIHDCWHAWRAQTLSQLTKL